MSNTASARTNLARVDIAHLLGVAVAYCRPVQPKPLLCRLRGDHQRDLNDSGDSCLLMLVIFTLSDVYGCRCR